jgi:hypothetical protein
MAGDCVWRIVDVACIREVTFSFFRISFHSSVLLKKNITVHYILETSNLDIDLSIIFSRGQKTAKRERIFGNTHAMIVSSATIIYFENTFISCKSGNTEQSPKQPRAHALRVAISIHS